MPGYDASCDARVCIARTLTHSPDNQFSMRKKEYEYAGFLKDSRAEALYAESA
jgi:hypothetical protein